MAHGLYAGPYRAVVCVAAKQRWLASRWPATQTTVACIIVIRWRWRNPTGRIIVIALSPCHVLLPSPINHYAAYVLKRDSANDITITQMFITLAIMLEVY